MVTQLVEDILKTDQGSAYIYEAIKNRPKQVLNLVEDQLTKLQICQRVKEKFMN